MLTTLLLASSLALPVSDDSFRLDMSLAADVGYYSQGIPALGGGHSETYAGGGLSGHVYLRAVHDDDAPPDFQPFLQRVGVVSYSFSGAGAVGLHGYGYDSDYAGRHWFDGSLGVDGYVAPWLHVGTGLGFRDDYYGYRGGYDEDDWQLQPYVDVGIRWQDALISVGWSATPVDVLEHAVPGGRPASSDGWKVHFWGGVYADGYVVVRRRASLDLHVEVLQHGASVFATGAVYFGRRLALIAGVGGGHGGYNETDSVSGQLGLRGWLTPRLAVALAYQPSWSSTAYDAAGTRVVSNAIEHHVALTFTFR